MSTDLSSRIMSESKRTTAIVLTGLLAIAGLTAIPSSASASTAANPSIIFDGNTLATSVPASEASTRVSADSLRVSTESLVRTVVTTRSGYSFGGWSLTRGGAAATAEITTATTGDTTRTLFAVWNTTLNYNTNGATSGSVTGAKTNDTYRFGQTLTLPTAGTLARSGFAFGGWMPSTVSASRVTSYSAGLNDTGNATLYAAWIKTVTFNANSATTGTVPASQVFLAGDDRLKLPTFSEMTLRKPGYEFLGWSTTATGAVVSGPSSYEPVVSQQTLYAIWKIQTTKASTIVFFNPGKSILRAAQKLAIRDLVDSTRGKTGITLNLVSNRSKVSKKALGKARNAAVVAYITSLGVTATVVRENKVSSTNLTTAKKVNRVTINAAWTIPN
jgi:uncharacterized repeat protein (TIGR02543 family)